MSRGARLAAFLAPPITGLALLYHALSHLQITVLRSDTLLVISGTLGAGLVAGLVAALGRDWMRVVILSATAVLWMDMALPLRNVLDPLEPASRAMRNRDRKRVADIHTIQEALETYITKYGPLPRPRDYGEGMGPVDFWQGWWDVSSEDQNGDGRPFLDFLVTKGILADVPLDPENRASPDGDPTRGRQYAYFVSPFDYTYEGGTCEANAGYSTYLLGVTDLEGQDDRPPTGVPGSGCECLWRNKPRFFEQYFDYVVCGRFKP